MLQGFPLQVYPRTSPAAPGPDAALLGCSSNNRAPQTLAGPSALQPPPFPPPMVTPIVALVLPDYLYPPVASRMAPPPPAYHPPGAPGLRPFSPNAFSGQFSFSAAPPLSVQNPFAPPHRSPSQAGFLTTSVCFPPPAETAKAPAEGPSRSATPQYGGGGGPASPPFFHSSCSSPLNLLELELSVDRQDSTAPPPGGQGTSMAERENAAGGIQANAREPKQVTTLPMTPPTPPTLQIPLLTSIFRKAVECKVLPEYFGWFELSEADVRVPPPPPHPTWLFGGPRHRPPAPGSPHYQLFVAYLAYALFRVQRVWTPAAMCGPGC